MVGFIDCIMFLYLESSCLSMYNSRVDSSFVYKYRILHFINSFIHSGDLYSALQDITIQRRSQLSHGKRRTTSERCKIWKGGSSANKGEIIPCRYTHNRKDPSLHDS